MVVGQQIKKARATNMTKKEGNLDYGNSWWVVRTASVAKSDIEDEGRILDGQSLGVRYPT